MQTNLHHLLATGFLFLFASLPALSAEEVIESLPAKKYLQFSELDRIPDDLFKWKNATPASTLFIGENQVPFVHLEGTAKNAKSIFVNDTPVSINGELFDHKINLAPSPKSILIRTVNANGESQVFRLVYSWIQIPPSLRLRVKESGSGEVIEKSVGFSGQLKRSAFTQLVENGTAVKTFDLDLQKRMSLAFQISYPREAEEDYDGWSLTIKDASKQIVAEIKKSGSPPLYVDWSEVAYHVSSSGIYSYQTNLIKGDKILEGVVNTFEATESKGIAQAPASSTIYIEPRQEFGYLTVKTNSSVTFSSVYAATDLPFTLYDKFIIRATGLMSLPTTTPTESFTYVRAAAGMHLFGGGSDSWILGKSYLFRLDALAGWSNYTTFSNDRLSHINLILEPHLLLWQMHYFLPVIEFGANSKFNSMRTSLGMTYQFFLRPWSVRLGMGVIYDGVIKNDDNPSNKFSAFRFLTSLTFIL